MNYFLGLVALTILLQHSPYRPLQDGTAWPRQVSPQGARYARFRHADAGVCSLFPVAHEDDDQQINKDHQVGQEQGGTEEGLLVN